MRVYVESNAVLEIAFQQPEMEYVEDVIALAAQGRIDLSYPAIALYEPLSTVVYRKNERARIFEPIKRQSTEFARSRHLRLVATAINVIARSFRQADRSEQTPLPATLALLVQYGRVIHLDSEILADAVSATDTYAFGLKDAIVYSSLLADLMRDPGDGDHVFTSRDTNAFGSVDVRRELSAAGCRYIARFRDGRDYIRSTLTP